jgi:NAD(P)-dependent dehydrogenase (short-subunit alcohol dehydrogenase family)
MPKVCVITGGGSGMGLSAAKFVDKEYKVILTGRTVSKLQSAVDKLRSAGMSVEAQSCDVSDRGSVKSLVEYAQSCGEIDSVIHAAGISPTMAPPEAIFSINALGTIFVNEEFSSAMDKGCIIDIASMAAYMLPDDQVPYALYRIALDDPEQFRNQALAMLSSLPAEMAAGSAYTISKNFVIWYAQQCALKYGSKGMQVLSVSPGTFATPMGIAEGDQAAQFALQGALGRLGEPDEIGRLLAFLAMGGSGYLTATDILCDGGSIAAFKAGMHAA